jgi:hypothetical protein
MHTAKLRYDGTGGSLLGVLFGNAILTGITLVDAGHGV